MSNITTLLLLGNRFFIALLKQSQLALEDDDWATASAHLHEFQRYMARHRQAESDVLYAKLTMYEQELDDALLKLDRQYAEIVRLVQVGLAYLEQSHTGESANIIDQLIELTSGIWMSQEQLVYLLMQEIDEHLLYKLATNLACADHPTRAAGSVQPPSP